MHHSKKDIYAKCKRGYSRGEIVSETFVNKATNRVVYWCRTKNDLLIVPYNLQMMMGRMTSLLSL